jgi:hypothetical protein
MLQRDREEVVNLNCSDCAGSGWKIVDKDGTSGAERCHCGSVPPAPGIAPPGKSRQPSRGLLRVAKIHFLLPPADSVEQAEWDKVQEALRRMRGEIKAPLPRNKSGRMAAVSEQQIRNPTADQIDQLRAIEVEVNRLRAIELARRRRRDEEQNWKRPHDQHDGQAVPLGDLEGV